MATRHTKERLFEVMMKVNPELNEELQFKEYTMNKSLYETSIFEGAYDDDDENDEQISAEDEKRAEELAKKAETAVESDDDIQKPIVNQDIKGFDMTVIVPTYKKRLADKNIESLKKMARKLKIPEPEIIEGAPYQKLVVEPCEAPPCNKYMVDVYDLTIKVDGMFKLPGNNKLVAVVDNITGGSIEIDEDEPVPPQYLDSSGECDYCRQERLRGKNFIVKDEDKGEYLRLGSSCVKKYIGINPAKYIRTLNYLRDLYHNMGGYMDEDEMFGGEKGDGSGNRMSPLNRVVDINKVISIIKYFIKNEGYVKREWEYDDRGWRFRTNSGEGTADKVEDVIFNEEKFNKFPIDNGYIKEFLTFVSNIELRPNMVVDKYTGEEYDKNAGFNEYLAKVKQVVSRPNFRIRDNAFLASAINYFENEKIRQADRKEKEGSEWIGDVGQKIKIPYAKLVDARSGDGQFGTWYLWSFVDDSGNVLKKFGTLSDKFRIEVGDGDNLLGFNKGDVFGFTADIKKHDEYQGIKNTQLGRLSKL